jgi:hypothetical protein
LYRHYGKESAMLKTALTMVAAVSLMVGYAQPCRARGGGGFHGGGMGGFHGGGMGGGFGGFHGGGFGGGGFGGYHPGGFGGGGFGPHPGYSGFGGGGFGPRPGFSGFSGSGFGPHPSGLDGDRMGNLQNFARGGDFDRLNPAGRSFDGNRSIGQLAHTHLPSDFGFGHGGARSYLPTGHDTHAWSQNTMHNRAQNVRNNFWHHNYFNRGWWGDHPGAWFAAGWGFGRCWGWTAWPLLWPWYGWGVAAPIYYDYGTNIVYNDNEVYYGDDPVATAGQYYDQAAAIATSTQNTSGSEGEWKPLGVFGLVQGEQAAASAVFQLATSKDGAIGGNFCDMLTGSTLQVHGAVDKQTQRAAWTVGDNKTTVYDTGIYNLTKEEAPLLVHFGKDRTEQWMLVRLKQPEQDQGTGAESSPSASSAK